MRAWPLVVGLFVLAGCAAPSAEVQEAENGFQATVAWSPEHPLVGDEVIFRVAVTPDPGSFAAEWLIEESRFKGTEVRHVFDEPGRNEVEARVDLGDEVLTERVVVEVASKNLPEPTPTPAPSSNTTQPPDNTTEPDNETAPGETPRPPWASLEDAEIRPGMAIGGCTANFIFTSPTNGSVYIGTAAHCRADDGVDGCDPNRNPLPPGTKEELKDGYEVVVAYNSWYTMLANGETDPDACAYNDFLVYRINTTDRHLVNPAMLHYGGPECLSGPGKAKDGDGVFTYGQSLPRQVIEPTAPRRGVVSVPLETDWADRVLFYPTPGIPGDSGSPVVLESGCALGILKSGYVIPPGWNGVVSLAKVLEYAERYAGWRLELAAADLLDPLVP